MARGFKSCYSENNLSETESKLRNKFQCEFECESEKTERVCSLSLTHSLCFSTPNGQKLQPEK
jgi:hypothetical protein